MQAARPGFISLHAECNEVLCGADESELEFCRGLVVDAMDGGPQMAGVEVVFEVGKLRAGGVAWR